ncbi:protein of unknown function [Chitinophaga jiangningensis]|uniref:DUF4291 domain-containing protein n=1 Tax=Chitinophaga jiangningensis TaxID=1419482 RepID=A0A1M7ABB1_9BACT|nr:DUF4291 domain-containing protein [Chitinophaga jiangningensis]SHL39970.1 protein of unknown function [Chitinophaga jiangningensis]
MNKRAIRATFDTHTITVYQAFNKQIAETAVANQTFIAPPFKMERMTWIKPSFLWMMYRSGWATKENQEHVLQIKIKREGFEWAMAHSCLAHYDHKIHGPQQDWKHQMNRSPVRIQWDPEKDIYLQELDYRSIQMGLSGIAVEKYVNEWIVEIKDISAECHEIHQLIKADKIDQAAELLPQEQLYPLPENLASVIHAS